MIINFNQAKEAHYINAPSENIKEGEDLVAFKKLSKLKNDEKIEKIIAKALNENMIKHMGMGSGSIIMLTDQGYKYAKVVQANKTFKKKRTLSYLSDKILLPLMLSIMTFYIMTYLQNDKLNEEIEELQKEITWLKQRV